MEATNIQSALEVLQRPDKVKLLFKDEMPLEAEVPAIPSDIDPQKSAELIVAIAEHISEEDANFATLFAAVKQSNEVINRDIPVVFDYMVKSYEFLKDHWAEVYFFITILNKKGYFKKLKEDSDFKTFFEVFFDEKIK